MIEFLSCYVVFLVVVWMVHSAIEGEKVVKKFEDDDWWNYKPHKK